MISTYIENNSIIAIEDGEVVGVMEFERHENVLAIFHITVRLSGRGVGTLLMQAAEKLAEENDLTIRPICSFAVKYMKNKNKASQAK